MALIIEDGSLVVGANSFATVAEVRAYAAARASDLTGKTDAELEAALIVAMDYLATFEPRLSGLRISPDQYLMYPRDGVYINGFLFADDAIPRTLKDAQCQAALESTGGLDLMPTGDGRAIKKEKVDVIETEYAEGASGAPQPRLIKVDSLMAPLLRSGGSILRVERA
jgi:hypothetical protein